MVLSVDVICKLVMQGCCEALGQARLGAMDKLILALVISKSLE